MRPQSVLLPIVSIFSLCLCACSSQELLGQNQVASKSLPLICSPTAGDPQPGPTRPRWTLPRKGSPQATLQFLQSSKLADAAWTVILSEHCKTSRAFAVTLSTSELNALPQNCILSVSRNHTIDHFANDPLTSDQTHIAETGTAASEATLYNTTNGIRGSIVLAVIDDGVDFTHADLTDQAWVNSGEIAANGLDDDNNGFVDDINGWNFGSNLASPAPEGSADHGTHVAGLAAARMGNGVGGQGVMGSNVKIMGLNVFGSSSTTSTTFIVNAIQYAVDNGAEVINLSLGGRGSSSTMESVLQWAADNNVVIVAAAGNAGEVVTASNFYIPMGYAASISGFLSVGSSSLGTGAISSFSNTSTAFVEIAAPGSDPLSAGLLSTLPGSTYGRKQGTSMASPLVAGAAAIVRAWAKSRDLTLTAGDVEDILKSRAISLPTLATHIQEGRRLDVQSITEFLSNGCNN